jgi:hypothetical protein
MYNPLTTDNTPEPRSPAEGFVHHPQIAFLGALVQVQTCHRPRVGNSNMMGVAHNEAGRFVLRGAAS